MESRIDQYRHGYGPILVCIGIASPVLGSTFDLISQMDTTAAEFLAETNYLYSTYGASRSDFEPAPWKKITLLGSRVHRIGSSVEFDWYCVSAVNAASRLGYRTIMVT
jgi:hypothetical protein